MTWINDFARGAGVGVFIGVPVVATMLAFCRPGVFAFSYMREFSVAAIWIVGFSLFAQLKSLKVDKTGVEISFGSQPVHPDLAVPHQSQGGGT